MFVGHGSPLARRVSEELWARLSRAALDAGLTKTIAQWTILSDEQEPRRFQSTLMNIFVVGQDHPEDIEAVAKVGDSNKLRLYGVVVAVPNMSSPLAGSLLYQGVQRLTDTGVRAGLVEPVLLHAHPGECEAYAHHLLERLSGIWQG